MNGSNRLAGLTARPKETSAEEVRRVDDVGEASDHRGHTGTSVAAFSLIGVCDAKPCASKPTEPIVVVGP